MTQHGKAKVDMAIAGEIEQLMNQADIQASKLQLVGETGVVEVSGDGDGGVVISSTADTSQRGKENAD